MGDLRPGYPRPAHQVGQGPHRGRDGEGPVAGDPRRALGLDRALRPQEGRPFLDVAPRDRQARPGRRDGPARGSQARWGQEDRRVRRVVDGRGPQSARRRRGLRGRGLPGQGRGRHPDGPEGERLHRLLDLLHARSGEQAGQGSGRGPGDQRADGQPPAGEGPRGPAAAAGGGHHDLLLHVRRTGGGGAKRAGRESERGFRTGRRRLLRRGHCRDLPPADGTSAGGGKGAFESWTV